MENNCFNSFESSFPKNIIPKGLVSPYDKAHPIAKLAANELKQYITSLAKTDINFRRDYEKESLKIGKMFGVLVVKNSSGDLGYLRGFSGKVGDTSHYNTFVPPVVDLLEENISINSRMTKITDLTAEINTLKTKVDSPRLKALIECRKNKSITMQQDIYDEYYFLNSKGESKMLCTIFKDFINAKETPGAGECAAPKLFQFAFKNNLTPLALAEFWWGKPTKSEIKKHGEFYPPCTVKCEPILYYMLDGLYD